MKRSLASVAMSAVVVPLVVLTAVPAGAADGALDTTFGGDGRVIEDLTAGGEGVTGIAVQPDGKIVAVGDSAGDFTVARFLSSGALDLGFGGGDGIAAVDFGYTDTPWDVALQGDGKIVVVGETGGFPGQFALARLNADGTPDTGFSSDGQLTSNLGGSQSARAVAIQPSGRIIAAGNRYVDGARNDFIVAGYLANGTLDGDFGGGDGIATADFTETGDYGVSDDEGRAVALDSLGRIVVAGLANRQVGEYDNRRDHAVARFTVDGALDPDFSADGKQRTNLGETGQETLDGAWAVAVQSDDAIVAAGVAYNPSSGHTADFGLARYLSNGDLDTSFGGNGFTSTNFPHRNESDTAYDLAIQPDGKIVAAGTAANGAGDFALARYEADGDLDPTFDTDGRVHTDFGVSGNDHGSSVTLQSDGRIVMAGSTWSDSATYATRYSAFALTRYEAGDPPPSVDAVNDSYATVSGRPMTVPARGVLDNDSGAGLTATLLTPPPHGSLALAADGGFSYTPVAGFVGSVSFTYQAANAGGGSDTATVWLTFTAAAPAAGLTATPAYDALAAATPKPRVTLRWTNPIATQVDAVTVRWTNGSGWQYKKLGAVSAATLTGLLPGKRHSFGVRTEYAGTADPWSATVALDGSTLTITAPTATSPYEGVASLTGLLRPVGVAAMPNGRTVVVQRRVMKTDGTWTGWATLRNVTTDAYDRYATTDRMYRNSIYRTAFTGAGGHLGSVSPARRVNVAPRVWAQFSDPTVRVGTTARLAGTVTPSLAGKRVYLQQYVSGAWKTITYRTLSSTSGYSFALAKARGTYMYRVYVPAYAPFVAGRSPSRSLVVS